MKLHRLHTRSWVLWIAIGLIAGHLLVPYLLTHLSVSVAAVSGVTLFLVAKHLGLVAALAGQLRAQSRQSQD
jgi:nitric oxide reductase large subunit